MKKKKFEEKIEANSEYLLQKHLILLKFKRTDMLKVQSMKNINCIFIFF